MKIEARHRRAAELLAAGLPQAEVAAAIGLTGAHASRTIRQWKTQPEFLALIEQAEAGDGASDDRTPTEILYAHLRGSNPTASLRAAELLDRREREQKANEGGGATIYVFTDDDGKVAHQHVERVEVDPSLPPGHPGYRVLFVPPDPPLEGSAK